MHKFIAKVAKEKISTSKFDHLFTKITSKEHSLKILTWNVNGLRSFKQNPGFLEAYIAKENPDIFCFQETKMTDDFTQEFEYSFDGYKPFFNCCSVKKGYSGVVCYSKKIPISIEKQIGSTLFDKEGRSLILEYKKFILINLYVPNSGEGLKRINERQQQWDDTFAEKIKELKKKNKPIIITGDLNVAYLNMDVYDFKKTYNKVAGNTQIEKDGMTKILNLDIIDSYRKLYPEEVQYKNYESRFTFFSARGNARVANHGWRLDYFLLSKELEENLVDCAVRQEIAGSDHVPVVLLMKDIDLSEDKDVEESYMTKKKDEVEKEEKKDLFKEFDETLTKSPLKRKSELKTKEKVVKKNKR